MFNWTKHDCILSDRLQDLLARDEHISAKLMEESHGLPDIVLTEVFSPLDC